MIQVSCATYSVNGIKVYDRQVDSYMSKRTIEALINFSITELGNDAKIYEDWDFVFTSAWLGQMKGNKLLMARHAITSYEYKVVFLRVNKCHWDSGIVHEMMHIILLSKSGDGDLGHKNKKAWDKVKQIENYMIEKNCPEGYKFSEVPKELY